MSAGIVMMSARRYKDGVQRRPSYSCLTPVKRVPHAGLNAGDTKRSEVFRLMARISRIIFYGLLIVILFSASQRDSIACPHCNDAIANSSETELQPARGYSYSIYFMMATPFSMAATISGVVWWSLRRRRLLHLEEQGKELPNHIDET